MFVNLGKFIKPPGIFPIRWAKQRVSINVGRENLILGNLLNKSVLYYLLHVNRFSQSFYFFLLIINKSWFIYKTDDFS